MRVSGPIAGVKIHTFSCRLHIDDGKGGWLPSSISGTEEDRVEEGPRSRAQRRFSPLQRKREGTFGIDCVAADVEGMAEGGGGGRGDWIGLKNNTALETAASRLESFLLL